MKLSALTVAGLLLVLLASLRAPLYAQGTPGQFTLFTEAKPGPSGATAGVTTTAAATSDRFEQWLRYPAEQSQQYFQTMVNGNTAYFRDFFAAGETFSSGANDGDTLEATATDPNGSPVGTWAPIVFHSSYNGQQNCWVGGFPTFAICNTTSLDVTWYFNSQCGVSGSYTMSFSRNAVTFFTGSFTLVPSINPNVVSFMTLGNYDQGAYQGVQYGSFCWITDPATGAKKTVPCSSAPGATQATIPQLGCLLTDYAATLTYHGLSTTPTQLNTWLTANQGFDKYGAIWPWKILQYAHQGGVNLAYQREPAAGDSAQAGGLLNGIARQAVCAKGPTPIHVKHNNGTRNHFVTAWGRPQPESTYLLKDPNGGIDDRLDSTNVPSYDYDNVYYGTRELEGTGTTFNFGGGISITLHSPAELLVTDPSGLRTGFDPTTNTWYAENPNATYGDDSIDDPTDTSDNPVNIHAKSIEISPPAAGTYTVTVTGTGSGTYNLEFGSFDSNFQASTSSLDNVPVSPGSVQQFAFTAPVVAGTQAPLYGAFADKSQSQAVNGFLTYANPTTAETDLPAGTASFALFLFYDPATIANSFTATLNGADASSLFHPSPGGFEVVSLPLVAGSNVLVLSIQGTHNGRVSTDTDRLTFGVGK